MGTRRGNATRAGRNAPCGCGTGRKVKHCCGQRRGPSEFGLAAAEIAVAGRAAARRLARIDEETFTSNHDTMLGLPDIDDEMVVDLPRLHTLEVERLGVAIEDEDPVAMADALRAVLAVCDSPMTRRSLLRAVELLFESGRIDRAVADVAAFDLSRPESELLEVSVLQAVAVDSGAAPTAGGLLVATR